MVSESLTVPVMPTSGAQGTFRQLIEALLEQHDREVTALQAALADAIQEKPVAGSTNPNESHDAGDDNKNPEVDPTAIVCSEGPHTDSSDSGPLAVRESSQEPDDCPPQPIPEFLGGRHRISLAMALRAESLSDVAGQKPPLARLVKSLTFELVFAVLILLNGLVKAVEVQHEGNVLGYKLGYWGARSTEDGLWPGEELAFTVVDVVFGLMFLTEIILKLFGLGCAFFMDAWNWIDMIIMTLWCLSLVFEALVNATVFRILRLLRLIRIFRILRTLESFDALFIMTTAMRDSAPLLFWAVTILVTCETVLALSLCKILHLFYFVNTSSPASEKQLKMYEYFGTFGRCMMSMFEISLANWPPAVRMLAEEVSVWFMMLGVIHKLVTGFAVVGVINGVFMQETFKTAANDDAIMMRQREKAIKMHTQKMKNLFLAADASNDGVMDFAEFKAAMKHQAVKTWLNAMDLDTSDIDTLFNLIGDKSGRVTADGLARAVATLKGAAKSMDLHRVLLKLQEQDARIAKSMDMRLVLLKLEEQDARMQKICEAAQPRSRACL